MTLLSLIAKHYVQSKFHLSVLGVTKGGMAGRRQPYPVSSYHRNSPLPLTEKLGIIIWTQGRNTKLCFVKFCNLGNSSFIER